LPTTLYSAADVNLYKATAIRFSTSIGSLTQHASEKCKHRLFTGS